MDLRTPDPRIAYFSMEIAFDPAVPTYSGGLGILAGDTLRAAADLGVPMVAVSSSTATATSASVSDGMAPRWTNLIPGRPSNSSSR